MKNLIVAALLAVPIFAQITDTVFEPPVSFGAGASDAKLETILTLIITMLTIGLEILRRLNSKNSAAAEVLIKSIEKSNNNQVKAIVREEAKEEGNTAFLHKKVQEVVEKMPEPTPNGVSPEQPDPPARP